MISLQDSLIQSVLKRHQAKTPKKPKRNSTLKVKIKRKAEQLENEEFGASPLKRSRRSSTCSSLTASLYESQDNGNTGSNLSLLDGTAISLDETRHDLNVKSEQDTEKYLCNHFGKISISVDEHPKLFAVINHVKDNDFILPELNLENWRKWPGSKPNIPETKNLKEKYSSFSRSWTVEDEERLMKRFSKIMNRCGLSSESGCDLLEEIRSLPIELSAKVKCIVAGYIGRPFLTEKLAIMVWKRLSNKIQPTDANDNESSINESSLSTSNINEFEFVAVPENNESDSESETLLNDSKEMKVEMQDNGRFSCDSCDKTFARLHTLTRHVENAHSRKKEFTCELCDQTFTRADNFKRHKERVKHTPEYLAKVNEQKEKPKGPTKNPTLDIKVQRVNGKYPCDLCDKILSASWKLRDHIVRIHNSGKYELLQKYGKMSDTILEGNEEELGQDSSVHMFEYFYGKYGGIDPMDRFTKSTDNLEFYNSVNNFLKVNDFILPKINLLKWKKTCWPYNMPTQEECKVFKEKYPFMKFGPLTDEEQEQVFKRLDTLIMELGLKATFKDRTAFVEKMIDSSARAPWIGRLKVILGAYLGGKDMLKYRLATEIWHLVVKHISQMNEVIVPQSLARKIEKKYTDITERKVVLERLKNKLGFTRAELLKDESRGIVKKYKTRSRDMESVRLSGPFTLAEDKEILDSVFKYLNMNNIRQYEPGNRPIPWDDLFVDFDRRIRSIQKRWWRLCTLLKMFEFQGTSYNNLDSLRYVNIFANGNV